MVSSVVLLKFCLFSSLVSFLSALLLGWVCLQLEARFRLVAFLSFSCAMTYPYRVYLMAVALGMIRELDMRSWFVRGIYVASSFGSTALYTAMVLNILHTYLALTRLHQYDAKRMSRMFILLSAILALGNCALRILLLSEGLQKNHVNYLNLISIAVICLTGPPVLLLLALRTYRTRRASQAIPAFSRAGSRCLFAQWMILRFLLIALIMFVFACTNLVVLVNEMLERRFQPIELGNAPKVEDLVSRYGAAAWTGTVLLFVYFSGKEVSTWFSKTYLYR